MKGTYSWLVTVKSQLLESQVLLKLKEGIICENQSLALEIADLAIVILSCYWGQEATVINHHVKNEKPAPWNSKKSAWLLLVINPIPRTNHYFLISKILICQWKLPWLKSYLCTTVCCHFVSSEDWLTSKPWVQIYFSVRRPSFRRHVVFIMRKWWWGGEAVWERKGKCFNSIFFWCLPPPPRQFRLIKTILRLSNLINACIAHCKQILGWKRKKEI